MSQKWRRSQQWDREHFPEWAWPARVVLHTFSSIPLAVVLLSLVVVYATLASVPIGMLALAPTYLLYGLVLLLMLVVVVGVPLVGLRLAVGKAAGRGALFVASLLLGMLLVAATVWLWGSAVWPALRYESASGHGVRLFADFCERYKATTLRRLPGMEMSELEFYGWWPLRVVLLMFVANMVTATVRRIEFTFVNIGVLTVHTGIVLIALGSVYYHRFKMEGDTILMAGEADAQGQPTPGPPQGVFYDNTRVALWVFGGHRWEQLPLTGVPRYNDYNLAVGTERSVLTAINNAPRTETDAGRTLALDAVASRQDPELSFRVVGYASYADPAPDWVRGDAAAAVKPNPARFATLLSTDEQQTGIREGPVFNFFLLPDRPKDRVSEADALAIEWTRGMEAQRWADLSSPLPDGALHALIVDVPATGDKPAYKAVYPVGVGTELAVGETGWKLTVKQLAAHPPFPIITEGYRDADSSVAIVRLTGPDGKSFDRWLYHRFPEISQDMLDELNERGMPKRRDASPAIRVSYLDVSKLQVYLDEAADGTVRAIVRRPRGEVKSYEGLKRESEIADVVPGIGLRLGDFWDHVDALDRPRVVPEPARDKEEVGNHGHAMVAIEVSLPQVSHQPRLEPTLVWLPFSRYVGVPGAGADPTMVRLANGRTIAMSFGRRSYVLPGFMVQLLDFTMEAYDHRGAPRDYQSLVRVLSTDDAFQTYDHVTKLNAPLQAPFEWLDDRRSWLANAWGTFVSRLSPRQFKFSQAGWDRSGWEQTQAAADRGEVPRPLARFTILQVGNNPGIHVIAAGGILMSVGIPWAFYVKPWLVRRRKKRLEADLKAGREVRKRSRGGALPTPNGSVPTLVPDLSRGEIAPERSER